MDISVVIVTYNSAGQIEDCLASLGRQTGVSFETIVVDNASQDDSLARARKILAEILMPNKNKKAVDSENGVE